MDALTDIILNTPVFPFLWVPHSILMSVALRATLGPAKWREFSREHPLSCFLLALLYIYPGGILASFIQGQSLIAFLKLSPNLYAACISWYLVFYSPLDVFYQTLIKTGVLPFLTILQDWQRVGLVLSGLETINSESPGYFLYPVVFGVIKSSGFMVFKYIEVGLLQGLKTGFKVPNQQTKTMVVSAVLLQLQILYSVLPLSVSDLYCCLVLYTVVMRLITVLLAKSDWDPYLGLESGVCTLVYGAPVSTENTKISNPKENTEKKPAEEKKDD